MPTLLELADAKNIPRDIGGECGDCGSCAESNAGPWNKGAAAS